MKLWKMQKLTTGKTKSRLTVTRIGEGRVANYKGDTRGRSEHRLRSVNTRVAHTGLHSLSKPTELHVGRDISWIPGLGRSPGGGNGNPLQDSCLKNPMDKRA